MAESETTTDTLTEDADAAQAADGTTPATGTATPEATATDTAATAADNVATSTVIDLRAPKGVKRELYRLGLRFAYAQDSLEVWEDGVRGTRATFTPDATGGILLEDTATHVTATVTLEQLTAAALIETMAGGDE